MTLPLMPKATAVWLIDNTTLTFEQIAEFCGMHSLEVKVIADGEVAQGIHGVDPVLNGQLTKEEIERCQNDPQAKLKLSEAAKKHAATKPKKKTKYTPIARRQDKPDAVMWFVRNHPEVTEAQICKLIGTTKSTINSIKHRTHWNINNMRPRDPVLLGLCTQIELDKILEKAKLTLEKQEKAQSAENENSSTQNNNTELKES